MDGSSGETMAPVTERSKSSNHVFRVLPRAFSKPLHKSQRMREEDVMGLVVPSNKIL